MIWLHIIADFKKVNFNKININQNILEKLLSKSIKKVWLTDLGSYYHTFTNMDEITCIVALAESHISIHTWPEKQYISLDIFVCNIWWDNSRKAKEIYQILIDFFNPWDIDEMLIDRKSV